MLIPAEHPEEEAPATDGSREELTEASVNLEQPCVSWYHGLQPTEQHPPGASALPTKSAPGGSSKLRGQQRMKHFLSEARGPSPSSLPLLSEGGRAELRETNHRCATHKGPGWGKAFSGAQGEGTSPLAQKAWGSHGGGRDSPRDTKSQEPGCKAKREISHAPESWPLS